jgi:predicted DNA-binding transcriptional regulator AlpA
MSKLLTRREVAELLGLAPQTLAKWAMTGKNLSVVKLGNRTTRYLFADVMSFISLSTTNGRSGNCDYNAGQVEQMEQYND